MKLILSLLVCLSIPLFAQPTGGPLYVNSTGKIFSPVTGSTFASANSMAVFDSSGDLNIPTNLTVGGTATVTGGFTGSLYIRNAASGSFPTLGNATGPKYELGWQTDTNELFIGNGTANTQLWPVTTLTLGAPPVVSSGAATITIQGQGSSGTGGGDVHFVAGPSSNSFGVGGNAYLDGGTSNTAGIVKIGTASVSTTIGNSSGASNNVTTIQGGLARTLVTVTAAGSLLSNYSYFWNGSSNATLLLNGVAVAGDTTDIIGKPTAAGVYTVQGGGHAGGGGSSDIYDGPTAYTTIATPAGGSIRLVCVVTGVGGVGGSDAKWAVVYTGRSGTYTETP